jgi:MoxR-like ATPase
MTQTSLDPSAIDRLHEAHDRILAQLSRVIVGQSQVIEELLICLFSRGHCLLEGVPGLAKTLLVSTLAKSLDLSFSRIQFTPDLMPMDITGTEILQDTGTGRREFEFAKGPVFANIVLADEINRAPSKTQAAMLEAMQEHRVTVAGHSFDLHPPFFVLATQNPIEQEGTYPLPEAQLDRFMFMIGVDYPSREEELEIARTTTGETPPRLKSILTGEEVIRFQQLVRRTGIEDIKSLAAMIIQSERFGTSLSQALKVYADALRMRRRLRGEKAVGEAGIKMVLATVVFILPVVFIITLVPAMLTMLNNLRGGIGASAR